MMADLGTKVTILEALPKILPGCDEDVTKRRRAVVHQAGHRDPHRRRRSTGHEPQPDGGTTVQFGDGESLDVDLVVVSVGRRPYTDASGSTAPACGRRPRLRRGRRVLPHRRARRVGGRRRHRHAALAHVGFAEAIIVVQGHPRRGAGAGRLRQGAVGDLLPARGRVRGLLRGGGQGGGLRRRHLEAPLQRQRPGA